MKEGWGEEGRQCEKRAPVRTFQAALERSSRAVSAQKRQIHHSIAPLTWPPWPYSLPLTPCTPQPPWSSDPPSLHPPSIQLARLPRTPARTRAGRTTQQPFLHVPPPPSSARACALCIPPIRHHLRRNHSVKQRGPCKPPKDERVANLLLGRKQAREAAEEGVEDGECREVAGGARAVVREDLGELG